ncbi:MAG: hypothetical protein ACOYIE_05245 [Agathobaculum sp.]
MRSPTRRQAACNPQLCELHPNSELCSVFGYPDPAALGGVIRVSSG